MSDARRPGGLLRGVMWDPHGQRLDRSMTEAWDGRLVTCRRRLWKDAIMGATEPEISTVDHEDLVEDHIIRSVN